MTVQTHRLITQDPRDLLFAGGNTGQATGKGAAIGGTIGSAVPLIGTAIGTAVGAAAGFVAGSLDGASQDRFFDRYFEIKDDFKDAGYPVKGKDHDKRLTEFKIRKTQVKDKKDEGYQAEFNRLHRWAEDMLDDYNPGLGDYWVQVEPSFDLATLGNISKGEITELKELIKMFPPGTYKGEDPFGVVANLQMQGATDQQIEALTGLKVNSGPPKAVTAGISIVVVVIFILIILGMTMKR